MFKWKWLSIFSSVSAVAGISPVVIASGLNTTVPMNLLKLKNDITNLPSVTYDMANEFTKNSNTRDLDYPDVLYWHDDISYNVFNKYYNTSVVTGSCCKVHYYYGWTYVSYIGYWRLDYSESAKNYDNVDLREIYRRSSYADYDVISFNLAPTIPAPPEHENRDGYYYKSCWNVHLEFSCSYAPKSDFNQISNYFPNNTLQINSDLSNNWYDTSTVYVREDGEVLTPPNQKESNYDELWDLVWEELNTMPDYLKSFLNVSFANKNNILKQDNQNKPYLYFYNADLINGDHTMTISINFQINLSDWYWTNNTKFDERVEKSLIPSMVPNPKFPSIDNKEPMMIIDKPDTLIPTSQFDLGTYVYHGPVDIDFKTFGIINKFEPENPDVKFPFSEGDETLINNDAPMQILNDNINYQLFDPRLIKDPKTGKLPDPTAPLKPYKLALNTHNPFNNNKETYTITIYIVSFFPSFNLKWYGWNPDNNVDQRDLITPTIPDPKDPTQIIPNPAYRADIDPNTGTSSHLIWINHSSNFHNGLDPLDANNKIITDFKNFDNGYLANAVELGMGVNENWDSNLFNDTKRGSTVNDATHDFVDNDDTTTISPSTYWSKSGYWHYLNVPNTVPPELKFPSVPSPLISEEYIYIGNNYTHQDNPAYNLDILKQIQYDNPNTGIVDFWSTIHGQHLNSYLKKVLSLNDTAIKTLKFNQIAAYWYAYISDVEKGKFVPDVNPNNQFSLNNLSFENLKYNTSNAGDLFNKINSDLNNQINFQAHQQFNLIYGTDYNIFLITDDKKKINIKDNNYQALVDLINYDYISLQPILENFEIDSVDNSKFIAAGTSYLFGVYDWKDYKPFDVSSIDIPGIFSINFTNFINTNPQNLVNWFNENYFKNLGVLDKWGTESNIQDINKPVNGDIDFSADIYDPDATPAAPNYPKDRKYDNFNQFYKIYLSLFDSTGKPILGKKVQLYVYGDNKSFKATGISTFIFQTDIKDTVPWTPINPIPPGPIPPGPTPPVVPWTPINPPGPGPTPPGPTPPGPGPSPSHVIDFNNITISDETYNFNGIKYNDFNTYYIFSYIIYTICQQSDTFRWMWNANPKEINYQKDFSIAINGTKIDFSKPFDDTLYKNAIGGFLNDANANKLSTLTISIYALSTTTIEDLSGICTFKINNDPNGPAPVPPVVPWTPINPIPPKPGFWQDKKNLMWVIPVIIIGSFGTLCGVYFVIRKFKSKKIR